MIVARKQRRGSQGGNCPFRVPPQVTTSAQPSPLSSAQSSELISDPMHRSTQRPLQSNHLPKAPLPSAGEFGGVTLDLNTDHCRTVYGVSHSCPTSPHALPLFTALLYLVLEILFRGSSRPQKVETAVSRKGHMQ